MLGSLLLGYWWGKVAWVKGFEESGREFRSTINVHKKKIRNGGTEGLSLRGAGVALLLWRFI